MSLTVALQTLSPATLAELQRMTARLEDQDNDCTRDPLFEVREKRLRAYPGLELGDADEVVWLDSNNEIETDPEELKELQAYVEEHGEDPEGWTQAGGVWETKHIQTFLTREGAEEFIAKRGHNYDNPCFSIETAYRNPELLAVQALLNALAPVLSEINPDADQATAAARAWAAQASVVSDDDMVSHLQKSPALALRLKAALARTEATPAPSDNGGPYYIASFKRGEIGYVLWWQGNNAGYTNDLRQAGIYEAIIPNYHDTEDTVPVPVWFLEQAGIRGRLMVDIGDSPNQAFWSAKALREAIAELTTNSKDAP